MSKYVILGSGGWAQYVLAMFKDCVNSKYYRMSDKSKHMAMFNNVIAVYSEIENDPGISGYQVVNNLSAFSGCKYILAVGYPELKKKLAVYAENCGLIPCEPIIHPHVETFGVEIGDGSMIAKLCSIEQGVKIGKCVSIAPLCSVAHDTVIGDYSSLLPSSTIAGRNIIGKETVIGANSCTNTHVKIGNRVKVGLGCAIYKDVPDDKSVIGNPSRIVGN